MLERGTTSMNTIRKMSSFWSLGKSTRVNIIETNARSSTKHRMFRFKAIVWLVSTVALILSLVTLIQSRAYALSSPFKQVPECTHALTNLLASCNLALVAPIPSNLTIANSDITWELVSLSKAEQTVLHGQVLQVALPVDTYDITLIIGNYQEKIRLTLEDKKLSVPSFRANIGILQASSDMAADWAIYQLTDQMPSKELFNKTHVNHFNGVVPTGEYSVVARINKVIQRQHVRITRGVSATVALDMPTGKINLVATLANFPAMCLMNWKLYRLDGGREEIAAPRQHAVSLDVPPGHYEAVAQLNGHERRREFTVLNGTSSNVILAMD